MRITTIAERCGDAAARQSHFAHLVVNLPRGHAGTNEIAHRIKDFCGKPAGFAHPFKAFRPVEFDGPVAVRNAAICHNLIFNHEGDITTN